MFSLATKFFTHKAFFMCLILFVAILLTGCNRDSSKVPQVKKEVPSEKVADPAALSEYIPNPKNQSPKEIAALLKKSKLPKPATPGIHECEAAILAASNHSPKLIERIAVEGYTNLTPKEYEKFNIDDYQRRVAICAFKTIEDEVNKPPTMEPTCTKVDPETGELIMAKGKDCELEKDPSKDSGDRNE